MNKKGDCIAVRPNSIIEARYDLTSKQNDILDIILTKIKEDDNEFFYEINIDDYKKSYKKDTSNIYRDLKKAIRAFEKKVFI